VNSLNVVDAGRAGDARDIAEGVPNRIFGRNPSFLGDGCGIRVEEKAAYWEFAPIMG
jgi:hypothetical protein